MKNLRLLLFSIFVLLFFAGCNQNQNNNSGELKQALERIEVLEDRWDKVHFPGLGETMRESTQVHHSNLWFTGLLSL